MLLECKLTANALPLPSVKYVNMNFLPKGSFVGPKAAKLPWPWCIMVHYVFVVGTDVNDGKNHFHTTYHLIYPCSVIARNGLSLSLLLSELFKLAQEVLYLLFQMATIAIRRC